MPTLDGCLAHRLGSGQKELKMKLGLLPDIHERNDDVRVALAAFREERADQVVVLGDLFEMGDRIEETCRLLEECGAVGVWGNHEFGLCCHVEESVRQRYPAAVLDLMARLQPTLEIDGCLFTHVEPWLDPYDIADLWNFDGWPHTTERLAKSFSAANNRVMIMGHIHRYFAATPAGVLDWQGEEAIRLDRQTRYLIGLAAVCDGKFAIFDTVENRLIPLNSR
jgi:predicted phosphodiesterase